MVPRSCPCLSTKGKVRPAREQESGRCHHVSSLTVQLVVRRHRGPPDFTRHQRRNGGGRVQTRGRDRPGPGQHQHLRGLFHHLLGETQTLPRRTESTLPRASVVL